MDGGYLSGAQGYDRRSALLRVGYQNTGWRASSPTVVRLFYASTSSPQFTQIDEWSIGSLRRGEYDGRLYRVSIPSAFETHHYSACVIPDIEELDREDNCANYPSSVVRVGPGYTVPQLFRPPLHTTGRAAFFDYGGLEWFSEGPGPPGAIDDCGAVLEYSDDRLTYVSIEFYCPYGDGFWNFVDGGYVFVCVTSRCRIEGRPPDLYFVLKEGELLVFRKGVY